MENLRDFLSQDFVLAVFVTYFVFKEICDLKWVDTWFAFPALDFGGVFWFILGNRVCENVERFLECADCLDRKW